MSTAAQRAAEKAARLAARHNDTKATTDAADAAPANVPTPEADTTPVRLTVDFAAPLFDSYDAWARDTNRKHRLGRSIKSDVIRALVRKLLDDEDLRDEIVKTLIAARRK